MDQVHATSLRVPSMWERADSAVYTFDVNAPFDFGDDAWRRGESDGIYKRLCRNGVRLFPAAVGGSGFIDHVRLRHGIEIRVANYVTPSMVRRHFRVDEPVVFIVAALSGDQLIAVDGASKVLLNKPELTLMSLPRNKRVTFERQGGIRQQELSGVFSLSAFKAAYGLEPDDLPERLRSVLSGACESEQVFSMGLERHVAGIVADTIDTPLDGELRAMKYAAGLSELVANLFNRLDARDVRLCEEPINWRDADLAHLIADRLSCSCLRPPTAEMLAKEFGHSVKRIQSAFKKTFGITIVEYALDRRMREAQQLLIEAKLSMSDIAERLGYAHQSSFATAFLKHVKMSPSQYRRHRAQVALTLR